jgi:hypothetical protein
MGIRIHTAIIYGVQLTTKETRAYEAFIKDKSRYWFLMRLVEAHMKVDWKNHKSKQYRMKSNYYDIHFTHYFVKRAADNVALKPYRPFWAGMSKEELQRVEEDLYTATSKYLKSFGQESEGRSFDMGPGLIQWPVSKPEFEPKNLLGYIGETNYAREVDYALIDMLDIGMQDKNVVIKGSRPWECGTDYHKATKTWGTFNGQNMLPEHFLPEAEREKLLTLIFRQHGGTQKQFIATKKAIWDKYHKFLRPYKVYSGDGWGGTSFYFYPIDALYELISKHIPAIKYDVMRLEKFLCFYWG